MKVVAFDLGNVLFDFDYRKALGRLAGKMTSSLEDVQEVLFKEKIQRQVDEEKEARELSALRKRIPSNHYMPKMVVLKSTKELTGFREFTFKHSARSSKDDSPSKDAQLQGKVMEEVEECPFEKNEDSFLG